ncbi:Kelch repeat-containing protein [Mangrovibacterium lignilyticum]|uniref:Kelch repeat-containing protein n=1 Tax=Mangrovibacterium lignilyticum TaxID=2668052 RepID=UPI0013D28232|nr:kelch repeat-containing protein [Mangrovibacterium lignilyticum]
MIRKNFFVHKWSIRALKIGLVLAIIAPLVSCSGDDDEDLVGNWVELSQFEGYKRTDAAGTTVDNVGYIGLGFDQDKDRLNDFWKYDATANQWTQIADFPGEARNSAVAFEAGGDLYVGTGFYTTTTNASVYSNDFYKYDTSSDTWEQIADFPGAGRIGAVSFTIDGIGYVGMGRDGGNSYKDFYAYDPSTMAWTQVNSYGGNKSSDGVAFVIDGEAYVCTGVDNTYNDDFYKYNASANTWTKLRSISDATDDDFDDDYDIVRNNAVAFTSGGKGYVATGGKNTSGSTVWEYNPSTDLWVEKTSFEGSARYNAVAFTINDKGFLTTGQNSSYYFDDIWRFDANAEYDEYD